MIGRSLGPYRVVEKIGEGGMGVVYRACDSRLGRDVALKLLAAPVAHDAERRLRFAREARLLASISHPRIGAIHGVEEADGEVVLVLELVEGPTLADRLRRGPLPLQEALQIARELAEAIDAAHEKGIVHRDLKPANIKLVPDRGVKVLDFGLAKALEVEMAPSIVSENPTVTSAPTRDGAIVGTAAYMSPEQARGLPIDKRTDIWAFGCVLYEMVTGRRAFAGPTISDTIVAVLERTPDWSALPESTPGHVRRLLQRCLEKAPKRRLRDIGDAIELAPDRSDDAVASAGGTGSRWWLPWVAALGATGLVAATIAVMPIVTDRPAGSTGGVIDPVRFQIAPPVGAAFGGGAPDVEVTYLALSPDGSQLAFIAGQPSAPTRIWIRRLSALDAEPVAGTEGAISTFWSPDSRSLAFFAGGKLKRLELTGGSPIEIADVPAGGLSGAWGEGQILYAPMAGKEIFRVALAGNSPPEAILKADPARDEVRLYWPSFLPDGRAFLYLVGRADGRGEVRIAEPGRPSRPLLEAASNVEWVEPDYVVFAREGTLLAQRVDLAAGTLTGEPFAIADGMNYSYVPARGMFTTSRTGVVVYQSHRDVTRLVRVDGTGREVETIGGPAGYQMVRVSRDRRQLLIGQSNPRYGTPDVWSLDLARRGSEQKLTSGPFPDLPGAWLPGHEAFVFVSGLPPHLFRRDLKSGRDHELLPERSFQIATDVTPDGARLLYSQRADNGKWDVWTLPLDGGAPSPLLATDASEFDGRVSPDGRAVAWGSDASDRFAVYVAAFPEPGARTRVSSGAGSAPRWAADCCELFYLAGQELMAVPIRSTPRIDIGSPRRVLTLSGRPWLDYEVLADGTFVAVVADRLAREQPLTVVLNWPGAVRR